MFERMQSPSLHVHNAISTCGYMRDMRDMRARACVNDPVPIATTRKAWSQAIYGTTVHAQDFSLSRQLSANSFGSVLL